MAKKLKFKADDIDKDLEIMEVLRRDGVFYYRSGAWENPIEGDRRDTGNGLGRNVDEVYINGRWQKKIEVGSVGTDMITLRDGLNDIKVKDKGRTFNIARKLKSMEGMQIGSSFTQLALTSNEQSGVMHYYPDKIIKKYEGIKEFDDKVSLPTAYSMTWELPDAIVQSLELKASKDTRVRLRLYLTKETDLQKALQGVNDNDLVYESLPDTEYKNPENPNYGGNVIPKGDPVVPLANEMYLTSGVKYLIVFDALEPGNLLGKSNVPFFSVNYYEEKSEVIMSSTTVEARLEQDITLDRNMWLCTKMRDVDGKKGDSINLIGNYSDETTCVGNNYDRTRLISKGKAQVDNDGVVGTIATEEWIAKNSLRKIMTIDELNPDETALLYKMNPPGYVSAYGQEEAEKYPMYKTIGYLRKFSCVFFPMVRDVSCNTFLLTHERGESANLRFVRDGKTSYCIIETVVRKLDGSMINMSIRTDLTGTPTEGHVYADSPYIPSEDLIAESYKQWFIDWDISENQCQLRIVDPNIGEWSVTKTDAAYIMDASTYYVGSYKREYATNVMRLFNVVMLVYENPDGTGAVYEVNERTHGIDTAEIVTRIRKEKVKVSDSMAVHVYPKESEDFHTFFTKSGVYYCNNMDGNLPPNTEKTNDFKAEVAVKDKDFAVIQVTNLHTGVTYTKNKTFGVWQDWLTAGSVWNPKIIDYGFGDNIQIRVSQQTSCTSEEILFNNRNPEGRNTVVKIELQDGWNGDYDIIIKPRKSPVSSQLVSLKLTTPTTQTPLQIGLNSVTIDENLLEIHVVANGCQWTDFGMGWKSGSYPMLDIQFINRTTERGMDMLVDGGVFNQELMPKECNIGVGLKIVNVNGSFSFQKYIGGSWKEVSKI